MANGLALIEDINTELAVIDSKKLAKISQRMVEIDRANLTAGKQNTQTTSSLMTLTMLSDGPYRRLRQVLAQIEKTRNAIEENVFNMRKKKVELRRLRESDDELDIIEADQIEHGMLRGKIYLEGALKELAMFQETYDEIKRTHNIPDNWDEVDMEKDEFIGKTALTGKKGKQSKRLVTIALTSDDAPLLLHDEPIFCNGKIIGLTTSGAWGFRVNKSLGIASLEHSDGINGQFLASREFEIEVACERYPIEVRLGGFYDPKNERMKG